ncbi:MAG: flagellar hook-length control protein FliK [Pseudomonadota bacterium]
MQSTLVSKVTTSQPLESAAAVKRAPQGATPAVDESAADMDFGAVFTAEGVVKPRVDRAANPVLPMVEDAENESAGDVRDVLPTDVDATVTPQDRESAPRLQDIQSNDADLLPEEAGKAAKPTDHSQGPVQDSARPAADPDGNHTAPKISAAPTQTVAETALRVALPTDAPSRKISAHRPAHVHQSATLAEFPQVEMVSRDPLVTLRNEQKTVPVPEAPIVLPRMMSEKVVLPPSDAPKLIAPAQANALHLSQPGQTTPPKLPMPITEGATTERRADARDVRISAHPTEAAETTPTITSKSSTQPSVAQTVLFASIEKATPTAQDASKMLGGDAGEIVHWDLRGSQSASPSQVAHVQIAQRADLPPHIAQQLAVAMQKAPDKPVEIALNPPELGRVRMVMTATETGVVVQVLTERTDTLDLMRRNINELGNALSELGYEDIAFSFGQSDGQDDRPETETDSNDALQLDITEASAAHPAAQSATPALAITHDSIDIRL